MKQRMMPSVLYIRVYRGGDIDSDHYLVIMAMRLKLREKPKEKRRRRFDVKLLQDASIKVDVRNCFEKRRTGRSVEDRWKC